MGPDRHRETASAVPQTAGRVIRWARLYDCVTTLLCSGWASDLRRRTVELADVAPGERVLDVGCGTGQLAIVARTAVGPYGEVCGIDPAPEMVELALRKAARAGLAIRFEVGLIEALPYPGGHLDVVLSSLVLHHLPGELKRRGLSEVRRVLKPGGRFLAVDFGPAPGGGLGHLLCVLGLRRGSDHAERLQEMFREAGFGDVETGPVGQRALAFVRGRKPPSDP